MSKLEKFISKIDHKIKFLNQIKSVLKKQFKLLKSLSNVKTNIPNEIKGNTSAYLRVFEKFDPEYNEFLQEAKKQNKYQHDKFFMQIEENYTNLQLFKEQLLKEPVVSDISVETNDSDFEMDRVYNNRIKLPFWKKVLFCGCSAQTDEKLIEMTEHTSNLTPS
ncbi:MAG: hypothetical protein JSR17_11900 [Proteobacteria bacterium]|nr:hypothetical protein [Pseudomonadota bacterium]